jgi:hypothetical protein
MGHKIWRLELDHWEHVVEIEYGFLSGVKKIFLDGNQIAKDKENRFMIGDHPSKIETRESLFSSQYYLVVDDRLVKGGREEKAATSKSIPGWAWLFIVACGAIPIVSLGGCVPGAIGAGGAFGCAAVARWQEVPAALRVVICIVITGVSWLLFAVFIWQFAAGSLFEA